MEANQDILAARAKLFGKFDSRMGGKGTQRRKVKAKHVGVVVTDDKKLQAQMKRLGLNTIPGIEEVNMFTEKNEVIHFKDPKVQASLQANTYVVSGASETKSLQEMLPKVISQLGMGNENLMSMKRVLEENSAVKDDIPDVETNFEDVSKDIEVD